MQDTEANEHRHIDWIILMEQIYSRKWRPWRNKDNELIGIRLISPKVKTWRYIKEKYVGQIILFIVS